ncbi:MAG: pyridoxal-phosphate dependent enzyme, partial [Clostridia bacterium]|nr:pyridoxal-phosphate dependent enzyme [Clostridia bacterium]
KKLEKSETVSTIADGIAVKEPGDITVELINRYADDVVTVSDSDIASSILMLIERCKMIVEPAGAASVAAGSEGAGVIPASCSITPFITSPMFSISRQPVKGSAISVTSSKQRIFFIIASFGFSIQASWHARKGGRDCAQQARSARYPVRYR